MTVLEAYTAAVDAFSELVKKFQAYAEASEYDGKEDFGKWLDKLQKATKEVESAYGDAKAKTATLEKTLDDYVKANRDKIKGDKAKEEGVKAADEAIRSLQQGLQEIRYHLDANKL